MSVTSWWYPVVNFVVFAGLLVAGLFVSQHSLDELHDLRRMERVPATVAAAVLPGETNLTGAVEPIDPDRLLTSPETNTPVVYYRYHIERETRDSDGNRRWETVSNTVRYVPFLLTDETGQVEVIPDNHVQVNATLDFQEQRGDRRYSVYRIHPSDTVFVFGEATRSVARTAGAGEHEAVAVTFGEASFRPIISQWSEAEERASVGGQSVLFSWLGLVLLSFSVVFFFGIFRGHNTIAYLVAVTAVMMMALLWQGYYMLEADLDDALERVHRHIETASIELAALTGTELPTEGNEAAFRTVLQSASQALPALSERERERARRIRIDVARRIEAYNATRSRFPELLLAPLWGHPHLAPLSLSEDEAEEVAALEAAFIPTRLSNMWVRIALGVGLLAGIGLAWLGIRAVRTKRMIENIPTIPVKGVSYGLTEVKGTVELGDHAPLETPLTKRDACWYRYKVEKRKRQGKKKKWVTIVDRTKGIPFRCRDDSDQIQITPSGAEVFTRHYIKRRRGNRRYHEWAIFPGEDLYVLGSAGIDEETGEKLEIREDDGSSFPYIVSTERERVVMYRYSRRGRWALNAGLNGFILAVLLAIASFGGFSPTDYMASALVGSTYLFVLVGILLYNDFVFLQHRADRNLSNIDVALQKRSDLVRNLETTVRELAAHEAGLLERVAQLRTTATSDEEESEGETITYHPLSKQFLALRESYPSLRSQEAYDLLMKELTHLEDEIALMRKGYNDAVERLNVRVETVPEMYLARAFSVKKRKFLEPAA